MNTKYFSVHNHSMYSNLRLIDSINQIDKLIDNAVEKGLSGICLTDHESLSGHVQFLEYYNQKKESLPKDFSIGLGNEIYLIDKRKYGQKYYHFILLAKDTEGHQALRELSSMAWYNSYTDRRMERVPTLYSELEMIVKKYPGKLIATTACIGGELGQMVINKEDPQEINNWISKIKSLFGDDFYIEVAPGLSEDQLYFNKAAKDIAANTNTKMIFATDSHFLNKEDRFVHKTYLNSKNGEREVDLFYEFCYMMSQEDAEDHLLKVFTKDEIDIMTNNTLEIKNKIGEYNIFQTQIIPREELETNYPKGRVASCDYPFLNEMSMSQDEQDRYWINECLIALKKLNLYTPVYLDRLNIEAEVILHISKDLGQSLTAYFNTLKNYIDLFWEQGSIVGPGRGSAVGFLSNYLLGITQIDPIEYDLPWFRFLNKERVELPDIDFDLAPSKRPQIFKKIREKKGELRLLQVATFGTEGSRSAVLTGCRGYRSEEYPEGIDSDSALYMASLIPTHRGFSWTIKEVVYGDKDNDRKPVHTFVNEVSKYPGLLNIILSIEGLVNKRSEHAAGIIFYNQEAYKTNAVMKAPGGNLTTQFSLHDCEKLGDIKFDALLTKVSDKIILAIEELVENGYMEKDLTLRELYNKYLHPSKMNLKNPKIWSALANNEVLDCFQFNTPVGAEAARVVNAQNIQEMTAANALMRLMSERGQEQPLDKYARYKKDINLWYQEMNNYNLTKEEIEVLKPYYESVYGVPPYQESLMLSLIDKDICGFTLKESNNARKIVAKKKMEDIPKLHKQVFEKASSPRMAEYIWDTCVSPQLGYGFSILHSLAYSFVGVQTLVLAVEYPSIYWNTACLMVNAGDFNDIDDEEILEDVIEEDDEDDEDENEITRKIAGKKVKSTDYAKLATALNLIIDNKINISLPNINKSEFRFKADEESNVILYGLGPISYLNRSTVKDIMHSRPYISLEDFLEKVKLSKTPVINLIKAGAFDSLIKNKSREEIMKEYLTTTAKLKKTVNLRNFQGLSREGLIPEEYAFNESVFNFVKVVRKHFKEEDKIYLTNESVMTFYEENFDLDYIEYDKDEKPFIAAAVLDKKIYQPTMNPIRKWIKDNHDKILKDYNDILFNTEWDKYCKNNISYWEMESLGFYYNEHELKNANIQKYGISDFNYLTEDPIVDYTFRKNGRDIPIFKLNKIIGTVISKDNAKSSINLLTTSGVVQISFRKEFYSLYNKRISEVQEDGHKKVMEKSWFTRGNKIMVTGIRSGDRFIPKKYARTPGHTIYLIDNILEDGDLVLKGARYGQEN